MPASARARDTSHFLFRPAASKPGPDGNPVREWLRDAFRYTPGERRGRWERLADLPRPAVAAPSPVPAIGGRLLVLGGDDGSQAGSPPDTHRGFPRDLLAYDPRMDRWEQAGALPFSLVTTATVEWNGLLMIPGGEQRPGVRSTEVWRTRLR
jgi:hypothetical protein